MPMITPSEDLPATAQFYRVLVDVPAEWQQIVDGLVAQGTTLDNYTDTGIGQINAINQFQELAGFFYMSDLCGAMALCFDAITNTPYDELTPGQQALYNSMMEYMAEFGVGTGTVESPANLGGVEALPTGACDNDRIFALTTQLTDYMNIIITDLYEVLAVQSTKIELIAELLDNIPGLGIAATIGDIADWLLDYAVTQYLSGYTSTIRDQIRCDLFCIALDNGCMLTIGDLAEYFAGKCAQVFTPGALLINLVNPLTGIVDATQNVYASHYFLTAFLAAGARWGMIPDPAQFAQVMLSFTNDSDPDWAIICDACADPCAGVYDFSAGQGDWYLSPGKYGVWATTKWQTQVDGPQDTQSCWISLDCGSASTVNVTGTNPVSNPGPYAVVIVRTYDGVTQTSSTTNNITSTGAFNTTVVLPTPVTFDRLEVILGTNWYAAGPGYIETITIT